MARNKATNFENMCYELGAPQDTEKSTIANSKTNNNKIRVQFDMGKKTVEKLDKMRDQIASPSRAHVVKIALALLETIMEEGGEKNLYLEKDGKKQHIVIPDLIIHKK